MAAKGGKGGSAVMCCVRRRGPLRSWWRRGGSGSSRGGGGGTLHADCSGKVPEDSDSTPRGRSGAPVGERWPVLMPSLAISRLRFRLFGFFLSSFTSTEHILKLIDSS